MTSAVGTSAEPISVSAAVNLVAGVVKDMPTIVVTGEISGFRGPAKSGHCYFQLKDENSAMDVIVWKSVYQASGITLSDGLEVIMYGRFSVYDAKGTLSFHASRLELAGEGLLRMRIKAIEEKLKAEGLMDASRKRKIPDFCMRVAVVTSLSGSVIDDVKRTLARRNKLVEIYESDCSVQGAAAPAEIITALRRAAAIRPDVILLVRGGGSLEDLMAFNDEAVARAVAACPVPVVTGIGHEPDNSICDMVSDRRMSTPTAAAESVAPTFETIVDRFNERQGRLIKAMSTEIAQRSQTVEALSARGNLAMRNRLDRSAQTVEALSSHRCLQDPLAPIQTRIDQLELTAERLHGSAPRSLSRCRSTTDVLADRMTGVASRLTSGHEAAIGRYAAQLDALSPLKVLSRGYAIMRDANGHVVNDARKVETGQEVSVLLGHGGVRATVVEAFEDDGRSGGIATVA